MEKEPMLRSTFEKLSKELEHLKSVERVNIAKANRPSKRTWRPQREC